MLEKNKREGEEKGFVTAVQLQAFFFAFKSLVLLSCIGDVK